MKQDFERGMKTQLASFRQALSRGERRGGWKTALSSGPLRERLGLEGTAVGYLLASRCEAPGGRHSLRGGSRVMVEPEVGIHLGRGLRAGASREDAARAIAGLGAALEIVDISAPPSDLEALLAGNVFQRGACFGPPTEGGVGRALRGVTARVVKNGAAQEPVDAAAVTGDPVAIVLAIAETLGAFGEQLEAGDRILAGSLVPPMPVAAGDRVELVLEGLGSVSLEFAD